MNLYFTTEQKERELHKIYLEDDDLLLEGEFVTAEEGKAEGVITGVATIEGERYHGFEVVFALTEVVPLDLEHIMNTDWDWYDFQF